MEVGKEWEGIETEVATISSLNGVGETETETRTTNYRCKVEKIEEVTVPAGTFTCFKVVEYRNGGIILETTWFSDEAKINIKIFDDELGAVVELISYELH